MCIFRCFVHASNTFFQSDVISMSKVCIFLQFVHTSNRISSIVHAPYTEVCRFRCFVHTSNTFFQSTVISHVKSVHIPLFRAHFEQNLVHCSCSVYRSVHIPLFRAHFEYIFSIFRHFPCQKCAYSYSLCTLSIWQGYSFLNASTGFCVEARQLRRVTTPTVTASTASNATRNTQTYKGTR